MGTTNLNNELKTIIRQDNSQKLSDIIEKNNIPLNVKIGDHKRTLIILSILFNSPNCLKLLINKGNDINIPDSQDQSTPFFLASKFNYLELIKILLNNKNCNVNSLNNIGLNALDIAIIRGNYEVCLYLIENTNLKIEKNLESYKILNHYLECPLFNLDLFYQNLINKIPIDEISNFSPPKKRKHQFDNKVPDPNESWNDFFKRMIKFELYQPPLIDKDKVCVTNSLYMKMQSKLIESEYDIKIDLDKTNNCNNNNLINDSYNRKDYNFDNELIMKKNIDDNMEMKSFRSYNDNDNLLFRKNKKNIINKEILNLKINKS